MKEEAMQTISVGDLMLFCSKQESFLALQIAQHIAAKPTEWICLWFGRKALAQNQNCSKELGLQTTPTI